MHVGFLVVCVKESSTASVVDGGRGAAYESFLHSLDHRLVDSSSVSAKYGRPYGRCFASGPRR